MAHYTKEELLKNAAHYFSRGEKVMFATSDGNYFYKQDKHHAVNHRAGSKTDLHELTKEDFDNLEPSETLEEKLAKAEKVLEKAKEKAASVKKPEAKEKADKVVADAQELVDQLKSEIEGNE